jgi:hypothetical protein
VIQEDERKAENESSPQKEESRDEPDEGTEGSQVAKSFGSQESREGILLERLEDVDFLLMEQVGDEGRGLFGGKGEVGQS